MNSSKVSRTFFLIFSSSAAFDIAAGALPRRHGEERFARQSCLGILGGVVGYEF